MHICLAFNLCCRHACYTIIFLIIAAFITQDLLYMTSIIIFIFSKIYSLLIYHAMKNEQPLLFCLIMASWNHAVLSNFELFLE